MARIPIPTADTGSGLLVPTYAELAPQTSTPAAPAAGKTRLYLDSSGLLQLLPAAGQQRRIPADLGSGLALPTSGMVAGDTYQHNALGRHVYGSGGWKQLVIPTTTNATTRAALATSYPADLGAGVRVKQTDTGNTWEWNGAGWKAIPDATFPIVFARQNTGNVMPASWHTVSFDVVDIDSHGAFTTGTAYDSTTTSRFVVPAGQDGTYAVEGAVLFNVPATNNYTCRIIKNNATLAASYGNWNYNAAAGAQNLMASTGRHLLNLVAGDAIQLQGTCPAAWSTVTYGDGASWLAIERIR